MEAKSSSQMLVLIYWSVRCHFEGYLMMPLIPSLYSVGWEDNTWIMNWKGFGRKRSWTYRGNLLAFSSRDWKNHGISGSSVYQPRFEPSTSKLRVYSVTTSRLHGVMFQNTYLFKSTAVRNANWMPIDVFSFVTVVSVSFAVEHLNHFLWTLAWSRKICSRM
jgi:hypothetical protein